jgi:hypothetical protein
MRLEQTRVALEPRSAANCLDLAVVFCGRHLGTLFALWSLFVVPSGLATYLAARYTDQGFWTAVACGVFGSAALGAILAGGAARTTFGEEFTLRKLLRDVATDGRVMIQVLILRIPAALASLICLIPGLLLAVRWGFLVESHALTQLHEQRYDRRTNELVNLEFADLVVRGGMIALFGCLLWIAAELTVDVAWTILFGRSLYVGRWGEMGRLIGQEAADEQYLQHIWQLTFADPAVLTLHLATGLAAYAVCRIAWFFGYVDLRVRRDCWDLELELLDEAHRLQSASQ